MLTSFPRSLMFLISSPVYHRDVKRERERAGHQFIDRHRQRQYHGNKKRDCWRVSFMNRWRYINNILSYSVTWYGRSNLPCAASLRRIGGLRGRGRDGAQLLLAASPRACFSWRLNMKQSQSLMQRNRNIIALHRSLLNRPKWADSLSEETLSHRQGKSPHTHTHTHTLSRWKAG